MLILTIACAVFCENDDIAFSGLMPKIRFERKGTLGKSADCCDFHFVKNTWFEERRKIWRRED